MNDFDEAILEFMEESGTTATYIKRTGTYDPAQGQYVGTEKKIPVQVLILDLTLQSNGLVTKFGTNILAGDKELFVRPPHKTAPGTAPLVIDPANDSIRVGNVEYKIASMKEVNPTGNDTIVFNLHVRR